MTGKNKRIGLSSARLIPATRGARARRDVTRRAAEEEERACNTSLLKLPMAREGAPLIKRCISPSPSSMVLNFSATCPHTWALRDQLGTMGLFGPKPNYNPTLFQKLGCNHFSTYYYLITIISASLVS